ncbi:DUF3592 domain-containing protein [Parasphingorhabdus litoris]|uniref:DUF3592 domain-containing protein n=1 Tax=Parasphingorhabdus litoris TaxID=394733 RepID=UPI001E4B0E30|nr:DUF3592 domain-containing protein [Parasphingorhabdus litoris]
MVTGLALALRGDLPFLRNPIRRVPAKIVRHDRRFEDGGIGYNPVFRFADERGQFIEVRDKVYMPFPKPVIGEMVEIVYPEGYPEKARIPYPMFRGLLYGFLGYLFIMLVIELTGWW